MAAVMIGVDPHKGSHTAVVISPAEEPLGELRVRASAGQWRDVIDHVAWTAVRVTRLPLECALGGFAALGLPVLVAGHPRGIGRAVLARAVVGRVGLRRA